MFRKAALRATQTRTETPLPSKLSVYAISFSPSNPGAPMSPIPRNSTWQVLVVTPPRAGESPIYIKPTPEMVYTVRSGYVDQLNFWQRMRYAVVELQKDEGKNEAGSNKDGEEPVEEPEHEREHRQEEKQEKENQKGKQKKDEIVKKQE